MKAQVISIESSTGFVDGEQRVWLRFPDADTGFARVRFRRGVINTTHELKIDDEISLEILDGQAKVNEIAPDAAGKAKAKLAGQK